MNQTTQNSRPMLYTVKEVSQILHTNTTYVYELIKSGLLPALKLGSYKIRHETLELFLRESEGKDITDPYYVQLIHTEAQPSLFTNRQ